MRVQVAGSHGPRAVPPGIGSKTWPAPTGGPDRGVSFAGSIARGLVNHERFVIHHGDASNVMRDVVGALVICLAANVAAEIDLGAVNANRNVRASAAHLIVDGGMYLIMH